MQRDSNQPLKKMSFQDEVDERDISENEKRNRRFRPRTDLLLVKSILGKALAKQGLEKKIDRYRFMAHWPEIVGAGLTGVCKPDYFSKDTLVVRVINSGWAQELGFLKPSILQKVASFMPAGQKIEDIIFRVGPL